MLCHGGPIAEPDDAAYVLANTEGIVGFFGASSMERLPTEVAMTENMRRFKAIPRGEDEPFVKPGDLQTGARLGHVRPAPGRRRAAGIVAIDVTFLPGRRTRSTATRARRRSSSSSRARSSSGWRRVDDADPRRLGRDPGRRLHATYNDGNDAAKILAILSPAVDGYARPQST